MTSVGRCTCSIVQAIVADLPEPVMPRRVWNRSPRSMPADRASMARGWSPSGLNSETTWNGGTPPSVRRGCDSEPGPAGLDGDGLADGQQAGAGGVGPVAGGQRPVEHV